MDPNLHYCVIIPNPPADVYMTGGANPHDIPGLNPGEEYDQADFPFRNTSLIPTLNHWGMIVLGLLVAVSVIWVMKRRKRKTA